MIIEKINLSDNAVLTCYLHERNGELPNISSFPGILVLPGGGFRFCSFREAEPVAISFYTKGFQTFVLDYTTVTKKPDAVIEDPMEDVQLAIRHIREHEKDYLVTEGQLAMLGFSGGAHLAAAVATHCPLKPDVLLLGYPGILHSDLRALDCPDIVECVDETTPATFLFVGREDTVTPPRHALAFAMALDEHGVDYELHIFRHGEHGMSLANALTCAGDKNSVDEVYATWFPLAVSWLKDKFGEFTIYGVNDGRNGRFSIDSTVSEILQNPEATSIVKQMFAMFEMATSNPKTGGMTLRALFGYMNMEEKTMKELDEKLLAIK